MLQPIRHDSGHNHLRHRLYETVTTTALLLLVYGFTRKDGTTGLTLLPRSRAAVLNKLLSEVKTMQYNAGGGNPLTPPHTSHKTSLHHF